MSCLQRTKAVHVQSSDTHQPAQSKQQILLAVPDVANRDAVQAAPGKPSIDLVLSGYVK